jgi:phage baseplate assembly protein W
MQGTSNTTGKPVDGIDHLRQSITDILTTPTGSRVMRRTYGSRLFELVDAPLDAGTRLEIFAATAEALIRWEPRLKVTKVSADTVISGKIELSIVGTYLPDGQPITMDGIIIT